MPPPGVAAEEAVDGEHEALERAVLPERPDRVRRTGGVISTGAPDVGGDNQLVRPHEPDKEEAGEAEKK